MKNQKNILLMMILFTVNLCFSQEGVPTNSTALFEEYPVDLSTGVPQVNVSLGSYPTRVKNKNINLSVDYHPSSVAVFNQNMGDVGRGWNLFKGAGTVYKTKEKNHYGFETYVYNFFGFNGSFEGKILPNNQSETKLLENGNGFLNISIETNDDSKILRFTFTDNDGIRYVFETFDTLYIEKISEGISEEKPKYDTFHLSKVYTNYGVLAVEYHYAQKEFKLHLQESISSINVLNKISMIDFGEINFTYNIFDIEKKYPVIRYTEVNVKNTSGDYVKKIKFIFEETYDENRMYKLLGIDEVNIFSEHIKKSHKFYYKTTLMNNNFEWGEDRWGYKTLLSKFCSISDIAELPSVQGITDGVLQKITYPTGGSVLYEYENNTYSYASNHFRLDSIRNPITLQYEIDPTFYEKVSAQNSHNLNINTVYTKTFSNTSSGVLSFSVSSPQEFYFKFDANSFEDIVVIGDPNPVPVYPGFILKRNGSIVQSFLNTNPYYYNYENHCLGRKITLQSGNYTIEMSHTNRTTGSVTISKVTPKLNILKGWLGRGMRIKSVAYFGTSDINQKYLQMGLTSPSPVRRIDYNYNLFDEQDRSSGQTDDLPTGPTGNGRVIRYKNVTVYDSNKPGKIQYDFFIYKDLISQGLESEKFVGKLRFSKTFNQSNDLVEETRYKYHEYDLLSNGDVLMMEGYTGVAYPSSVKKRIYSNNNYLETINEILYNNKHQVVITLNSLSSSEEINKQKYFYTNFNNLFLSERRLLSSTEKYLNNQKLNTSEVVYSQPNFAGETPSFPQGYLFPEYTKSSKNGTDFRTVSKVNLYDKYGNIVEYENEQGTKIVNIWGYNNTQIVAKLEGISYSQVPQSRITAIQTASNGNNESSLLSALQALRNDTSTAVKNALITTYTYKRLIGISSETDYRGRRINYYYDGFGRLENIKDQDGNILKENEYYYQPQN